MNLICCTLICLLDITGDAPTQSMQTEAFTWHANGTPVALYDDALLTTKRIDIYPDVNEGNVGCMLLIDAETNKSLRITIDQMGYFFVAKGNLAVNTRNYDDNAFFLYKQPSENSTIIMKSKTEQTVMIFGICNGWLYVRANAENGQQTYGWLSPHMQCGNPYTTCN